MALVLEDRLVRLDGLRLDRGSHGSFKAGHCATEMVAWLAGEPHSDAPACLSPVLRGFLIRCNDRWGEEDRQKLKPFLPRVVGTAGDGKDDARREIARQYLVQRLPELLEAAGCEDAAKQVRGLPAITEATWGEVRDVLYAAANTAREARWAARERLRTKILTELRKRADAVAVAVAVAVADAVADAAADAVADAVADAAADADAVAVAVADAVADAAAVAVADAAAAVVADVVAAVDADAAVVAAVDVDAVAAADVDWKRWREVRNAVYKAMRERYEAKFAERREQAVKDALELLERMIDPVPGEVSP